MNNSSASLVGSIGALLALLAMPQVATAGPPQHPQVAEMTELGKQGGDMRMLVSRTRDTRLLYVYGFARLVAFTPDLELKADILEDFTVEEGRIFTFKLRKGHLWSDGHPFTTEDLRFYWEDMALNEALSPMGPPIQMVVDGELPVVEVIDDLTIRYTWSKPNPFFLPEIAAASPLFIYAPAHYLKPFHEKYADPAELARLVREDNARDWAQLFQRRERMSQFDNPDLPTLQPWRLTTPGPAERFIAERNPQFPPRRRQRGATTLCRSYHSRRGRRSCSFRSRQAQVDSDLQFRGLAFQRLHVLEGKREAQRSRDRLWPEARARIWPSTPISMRPIPFGTIFFGMSVSARHSRSRSIARR